MSMPLLNQQLELLTYCVIKTCFMIVIFKKLVSILFLWIKISCGCCWVHCNII